MINPRMIAAARALLGLSQAELAQAAGIHVNALRRLEAGATDPRTSTVDALVRALRDRGVEFFEDDRREGLSIARRDTANGDTHS